MHPKTISEKNYFIPETWPFVTLEPIQIKKFNIICSYNEKDIAATWTPAIEELLTDLTRMAITADHFVRKEGHEDINLVVRNDAEMEQKIYEYEIRSKKDHHFLSSTKPTSMDMEIMDHELSKQAIAMYWSRYGYKPGYEKGGIPRLQITKACIKCNVNRENDKWVYNIEEARCTIVDYWQ